MNNTLKTNKSKEAKKKFMNNEFVFPENMKSVELFCDDGESVITMTTTPDGDIHLSQHGVHPYLNGTRIRMSGSLINMEKQMEIWRTLKYLMVLLSDEDLYPKGIRERQHKLLAERRKGNW